MLVKTIKRHRYAGKMHELGDEYELAGAKHVRLLEAVSRVRRIAATIPAPPKEAVKPAAKKKVAKKKVAKKKAAPKSSGRKYKNKNMVSE